MGIPIYSGRGTKGDDVMSDVNSMYHAQSRSDGLKAQVDKLEGLAHHTVVNPTFDQFDADTEDMLIKIYGVPSSSEKAR
jgi:hypothetical protein